MSISRVSKWFVVLIGAVSVACSSSAAGDNKQDMDPLRAHLTTFWAKHPIAEMPEDSLEQSMVDFLYITSHVSDSILRREALDSLASAMGRSEEAYYILTDYLVEPASPIRDRALYREAVEALSRSATASEYLRLHCKDVLEGLSLNVTGEKVADLSLALPDGTKSTLHSLVGTFDTQEVRVLFYDPECAECERIIESMKAMLPPGSAVVAVSRESGAFRELPAEWSSAAVVSSDELDDKFYLPRLPSVYLVTPAAILLDIE